jgi:hypothetical protein
LGYVGQNKIFSQAAVKALRTIKYCALVLGFCGGRRDHIMLNHGDDDAAGAVLLCALILFTSVVIATAAAVFERILQKP